MAKQSDSSAASSLTGDNQVPPAQDSKAAKLAESAAAIEQDAGIREEKQLAAEQATDSGEPPRFTAENIDGLAFGHFRKHAITPARRMDGPFQVATPHGEVQCADGWLAIDASGNPYPIDAAEFDRLYIDASEPLPMETRPSDLVRNDSRWNDFYEIEEFRARFACALLQNPNVERFLFGSPLDRRRVDAAPNVGAYLRSACQQLARDYVEAKQLYDHEIRPEPDPAPRVGPYVIE
jgi:hypothetical protein